MDGAHQRTLERALQIVATRERLAAALGVSVEDLEAYMTGRKPLPHSAFLAALDIVPNGRPCAYPDAPRWRVRRGSTGTSGGKEPESGSAWSQPR